MCIRDRYFIEAVRRVHEGAIGVPVCGQVFYHTSRLRPKADPKDKSPQARLRNWVFDIALSGDIIVEQNIHVLDVANWYLKSHPIKAVGTGGRKARTDVGNCWDHFIVIYWYPNDVHVDFASSQFLRGFHDMCIRFFGTEGTVDSHYGGLVAITGRHPWHGCKRENIYTDSVIRNIKAFVQGIHTRKYLNNAEESAISTLTCILGRTAAYESRTVTWDEMMKANVRLEPNLRL